MRVPIAILSYNRPEFLKSTLASLRRQTGPDDEIALFQDGAFNPHSGKLKADQHLIEACISVFERIFPWGKVSLSPVNLGIAANYERAESYIFGDRNAPYGLFLEDDLVLSRHYLTLIHKLLRIAIDNPRIAYVSAYGDFWAGLVTQWQNRRRLMHMHENWGFAMTRQSWLEERPFRLQYLSLLAQTDYSDRSHERLRSLFQEWGFTTRITSQDGSRWLASLLLGKVRVTTGACYARYIGSFGEHFRPDYYHTAEFHRTKMAPWPPAEVNAPSNQQIDGWLAVERLRFHGGAVAPWYPGHSV